MGSFVIPGLDFGAVLLAFSAGLRYIIVGLLCVIALGAAKDFVTSNKVVTDLVARLFPTSSKRAPGAAKVDGTGRTKGGRLRSNREGLDSAGVGTDQAKATEELRDGGAFGFVDNLGSSEKYGGGGFSVLYVLLRFVSLLLTSSVFVLLFRPPTSLTFDSVSSQFTHDQGVGQPLRGQSRK